LPLNSLIQRLLWLHLWKREGCCSPTITTIAIKVQVRKTEGLSTHSAVGCDPSHLLSKTPLSRSLVAGIAPSTFPRALYGICNRPAAIMDTILFTSITTSITASMANSLFTSIPVSMAIILGTPIPDSMAVFLHVLDARLIRRRVPTSPANQLEQNLKY
jgi:hypothetical protein